jgi:hypothetical protein
MIMAGGDIAPVEPVVEAPVETSAWEFSGNAVAFYQTSDAFGLADLADGVTTANDIGLQLRAVNKDMFAGIGAGIELSGLYHSDEFSNGRVQRGDTTNNWGAAVTQAYLTYGFGNTSLKLGRQHLPKGLSPFAFTEGWQPIKNSFDAVLVVNSDLPDTTLVGAWVSQSNNSIGNIGGFAHLNAGTPFNANDGIYMLAAQNKSISGLTLTGNYYFAPDMTSNIGGVPFAGGGDVHAFWLDGKFNVSDFTIALQGGSIMPDGTGLDDTTAYGAKIGGNFGMFDTSLAYSSVDDGSVAIHNWGTNVKTPLYTQAILNQTFIKRDSDTFLIKAGVKALGGKFGAYYNYSDLGATVWGPIDDYQEFGFTYKSKITDNTTIFAAYVNSDIDGVADNNNFVRFWARYDFK